MLNLKEVLLATIKKVIVATFFVICIFIIVYISLGSRISSAVLLINIVAMSAKEEKKEEIQPVLKEKKLQNYPEYGTKYADVEIEAINIDLPVYFGDTLEILKKGVGHSSGSYFPGEGGTVIMMAHNSQDRFRKFSELKENDEIIIETDYGTFLYKIYDMRIVDETDLEALPIQKEKEILMIYTCYPFNNIGHAYHRYVVYADLIENLERNEN